MLRFLTSVWASFLLLVFALYVIDISEAVSLINLHKTVPFLNFGLVWTIVVLITVLPMYNASKRNSKTD